MSINKLYYDFMYFFRTLDDIVYSIYILYEYLMFHFKICIPSVSITKYNLHFKLSYTYLYVFK